MKPRRIFQKPQRVEGNPPARAAGSELTLSIGREGLGLELASHVALGPLKLVELSVDLPSLTFPLDVSGGVARFRHRRGVLRKVAIETEGETLAKWIAPRCAGILSPRSPDVSLHFSRGKALVTLVEAAGAEHSLAHLPRALAFDLFFESRDANLFVYAANARGTGLVAPATQLALQATQAIFASVADRAGACFEIENAAVKIARAVLPYAGARVPECEDVRFGTPFSVDHLFVLEASPLMRPRDDDAVPARIKEAIALATKGDDARAQGDLDAARMRDLEALERAPMHPILSLRIAEIDAAHGRRETSAIGLLRDTATSTPPLRVGALAGDLFLSQGDRDGAMAAYAREAESEESAALSAIIYAKAAQIHSDPLDALVWLDFAVSRAPTRAAIRWTRVAMLLRAGKVELARSDVEHLEAMAVGPREKFYVWLNAGRIWENAGNADDAGEMFENALRYSPDDPSALFGLGTSLVRRKRAARGIGLVAQAIEIADARHESSSEMTLALARALADHSGDLPAAIARARSIGRDAAESIVARGLEGRWRAALGDLPGASLAFARMRDGIEQSGPSNASDEMVVLLEEAAKFEREKKNDANSARRHALTALSARPSSTALRPYIEAAAGSPVLGSAKSESSVDPEVRAEDLIVQLKANPDNDAIVDELTELLSSLGRGMELLALLSARLEEASPARRAALVPKQRDVLAKLATEARAAGRSDEAALFEMAREALEL